MLFNLHILHIYIVLWLRQVMKSIDLLVKYSMHL